MIVLMVVVALLGVLALIARARQVRGWALPVLAVLVVVLAWLFTSMRSSGAWCVMGVSVVILFFLPWLDRARSSRSATGRCYKVFYGIFVVVFLVLGYLGTQPPSAGATLIAQICTLIYFASSC